MQPYYTPNIPIVSGIYCITCTITRKIYVGSARNLRKRCAEHFNTLHRNEHHNPKMQAAFNKYGPDAFLFEVLELVLLPELLTAREQYWFEKLKPFGNKGFNLDRVAGSSLGRVLSQITRDKIGAANSGKPSPNRGKKMTSEQLEHHILVRIGKKHSEEAKRNMGESHRGTKRSPETREKMRIAALGHAPTNARTFIVTSPDGIETVVYSLKTFCREYGLNSSVLVQVAKGKRKHYKGWTARYPESDVS